MRDTVRRWMAAHLPYGMHAPLDFLIVALWLLAIVAALVLAPRVAPEYCDQLPPGAQVVVPCFDR